MSRWKLLSSQDVLQSCQKQHVHKWPKIKELWERLKNELIIFFKILHPLIMWRHTPTNVEFTTHPKATNNGFQHIQNSNKVKAKKIKNKHDLKLKIDFNKQFFNIQISTSMSFNQQISIRPKLIQKSMKACQTPWKMGSATKPKIMRTKCSSNHNIKANNMQLWLVAVVVQ